MSPKEQVPRKDPLGANLSGKRITAGRISGERLHSRPPKGKGLIPVIELNFQAKGQRKGVVITLSFSVFLCADSPIGEEETVEECAGQWLSV